MERRVQLASSFCTALLISCNINQSNSTIVLDRSSASPRISGGICSVSGQIFSGILYSLDEKKDTVDICQFMNGKEHGCWKQFYPNKQIQQERFFDNGKKTGIMKEWWPDGRLKTEIHFKNNEYDGSFKEWNDKSLLIKEMNYSKGYEEGSQKIWYDDGKIKSNFYVTNGRRYGLLGSKNCINVSDSVFIR